MSGLPHWCRRMRSWGFVTGWSQGGEQGVYTVVGVVGEAWLFPLNPRTQWQINGSSPKSLFFSHKKLYLV